MDKSRGGIGSHKHGTSGTAPKSPRARFHMKREAKKNERKAKRSQCRYKSVSEALRDR